MRYAMRCWWLGVAMSLAALPALPLAAAERCRATSVEAGEEIAGHMLMLTLVHNGVEVAAGGGGPSPVLSVGDEVDLCFESSRAGLVSVWSHASTTLRPMRILPHEYVDATADMLGVPVAAGVRQCFSELAGQGVVLRVQPPLGEAEVYLHYAEGADGQIGREHFPSIGNRAASLPPACGDAVSRGAPRTQTEPYASLALRYEVVE